MERGLHERVVTTAVEADTAALPGRIARIAPVDPADQPHVLAVHVAAEIERALRAARTDDERLSLANDLLARAGADTLVAPPTRQLLRSDQAPGPGVVAFPDVRPRTPLTQAALLTNAHDEPSLMSELRAEIDTSDDVELLCAFVKWYGLRLLEAELRRLRDRGGRLRVVTTTYLGATDRRALDRLVREFGAEVRIQYDTQRTRLHAKAWLFRRATGFDTAYVGSSNLSHAALLDGVEWNVRLSHVATPSLLEKFRATFDTYWHDPSYEAYDPDVDRDRLEDALVDARGSGGRDRATLVLSGLDVTALPHQQRMLDELEAERVVHGRHRNLLVAATGTGKTVVAALDYRRLTEASGTRVPLLFVAHRGEILDQAMRTYREVLRDAEFGELYVGGRRPERWQHVFASIQSLTSYGVEQVAAEAFEVVVVDEFHHAQAASYRRLLGHLRPQELLGLTATPERADGFDVRSFFDHRTASELRLWDALGADLLCPFHYFVVSDHTDLRRIGWSRGRYDEAELDGVYTGNTARADLVLRHLQDKVADVGAMRALGFCVSVAHADFMASHFTAAGVPSGAVSGATPRVERERALADLRAGHLRAVFTVDVFNEGLDIPDVDTVLFLRPTESATVFLQQLGRGLRRTREKAVLTALDFVGHHRKEFRFDTKLRALTGATRRGLERDIELGFPFLPAGSQIVMDREAQDVVLTNVRNQVANRWRDLTAELRTLGDVDLQTYLHETGLELSDVVRRQPVRTWTGLRRDAGVALGSGTDLEAKLLRRVQSLTHIEDRQRASAYRRLLSDDAPDYGDLNDVEQRLARMLFFSLYPDAGGHASYADGLRALRAEPVVRSELRSIVDIAFDQGRRTTLVASEGDALEVHARYQREEILAALDYASFTRRPTSVMQGVAYVEATNTDILFVTLKKSEADYSPTTMYRDYPISQTLFHWESQSTTSIASPTGQRYLNGASRILLFVRDEPRDDFGTSPYMYLGPATYVSHVGERPIAITWRLDTPMPADLFDLASVAAS